MSDKKPVKKKAVKKPAKPKAPTAAERERLAQEAKAQAQREAAEAEAAAKQRAWQEGYPAALELANSIRAQHLGLEPQATILPGRAAIANHCPLANTIRQGADPQLEVIVTQGIIRLLAHADDERPLADVMVRGITKDFIRRVDRGQYPQLTGDQ